MHTSYFANPKLRDVDQKRLVSIAAIPPFVWGQKGEREAPAFAPDTVTLLQYKQGTIDPVEYTRRYLEKLDEIFPDRESIEAFEKTLGEDAILLCFERPEKFCHRKILADWLRRKLGKCVNEWEYPPPRVK